MPEIGWTEFGLAGIWIAAFIFEAVVSGKTFRRVVEDRDQLKKDNDRLQEQIRSDVVPLVREAITVMRERDGS